MESGKPILVTGSHRSGSTWVGRILSASPGIAYIHEPFNKELLLNRKLGLVENAFEYIREDERASRINSEPF